MCRYRGLALEIVEPLCRCWSEGAKLRMTFLVGKAMEFDKIAKDMRPETEIQWHGNYPFPCSRRLFSLLGRSRASPYIWNFQHKGIYIIEMA